MRAWDFSIAGSGDEEDLREFCQKQHTSGLMQLSISREPSYFEALCVEGSFSEVLTCRDRESRSLMATGNRSIKSAYINGNATPMGYLSGLRVADTRFPGVILSQGYSFLKERHRDGRTPFYLTTIMEDNARALKALGGHHLNMPAYYDWGRFECMALTLRSHGKRPPAGIQIRTATLDDAPQMVQFLHNEGASNKQFFPRYELNDFGVKTGLLRSLDWGDIYLALDEQQIVGTLACWDQRKFRQWRMSGYSPMLNAIRIPYNLMASALQMPPLPKPGKSLDFFNLAMACIRENDTAIFEALLDAIIGDQKDKYAFFIGGYHERDPFSSVLKRRRHYSLASRLFAVCWEDGESYLKSLDPTRIPYLELGSL